MIPILLLVVVVNATISGTLLYTVWYLDRKIDAFEAPESPADPFDDTEIRSTLAEHASQLGEFTLAIAHGIQHVDTASRRINATVARARKELSEHGLESPALEAEFEQLRLLDGEGSEEIELPPVPQEMGGAQASSIRGVSREQLLRARGFA